MFNIRVSLTGTPETIDNNLTGVDATRLVGVEKALIEGLQALVAEGEAAAAGNPTVTAAPDAARDGAVHLRVSAKRDGKPFAEATFAWHGLAAEHAAFIGRAFSGLDDAVAKG